MNGIMNILAILIATISLLTCIWSSNLLNKSYKLFKEYPRGEDLIPDKNGIIHHPTYGNYPEDAGKFYQGMSLDPGQSTIIPIEIKIPKEAK